MLSPIYLLCVYVICMHIFMHIHMCGCVYVVMNLLLCTLLQRGPEVNAENLPQLFSSLFVEPGSVTEPEACQPH